MARRGNLFRLVETLLASVVLAAACASSLAIPSSSPSGIPAETTARRPSTLPAEPQLPPRTKIDRTCTFTGVPKIVALGDLHGAYEPFVEILKGTEVVKEENGELHWAAGQTHLVQLGDIMDRGTRARDIFDLIGRLEGEAAAAGGRVHMLIGNHEEMNILGLSFDVPGGIAVEQFKSFLPEKYKAAREKEFRAKAGPEADLEPFWKKLMDDPDARERYFDFFNEFYGRWIARHNAVVKINDIVFVHGGLSESYSTYSCDRLNSILTAELERWIRGDQSFVPRLLHNSRGPLWYRELASPQNENILEDEVDKILANLGARAMVIAHTPTSFSISLDHLDRFGGKIWIIDTGIWMDTGGTKSALIIENGKIWVWPKDENGSRSPSRRPRGTDEAKNRRSQCPTGPGPAHLRPDSLQRNLSRRL